MTQLKLDEELRARNEMCHCGIRVMDSELPQGWSVHRSQEQETRGRLFFVSGQLLSPRSVDYMVVCIKSRDAGIKTILGASTVAMCTHSLPKLQDVTLSRRSTPLRDIN